jgi:hypothetical protein
LQEPNHRHRRLLRTRRERPRRRAAEKRHELAALHSITSSARARAETLQALADASSARHADGAPDADTR